MIAIVDYDTGNLASIQNMLKKVGCDSLVTNDAREIGRATHIILPGVGAFDYGMAQLKRLDLIEPLREKVVQRKTPLLGICLGAQLCCLSSEEGELPGLGFVDAHVKKFPTQAHGKKYSVPHMGWNQVTPTKSSSLFEDLSNPRFYFVHSYYIQCVNEADVLASNDYSTPYNSAFESGHILGVQFHPEKSHKFGRQILK